MGGQRRPPISPCLDEPQPLNSSHPHRQRHHLPHRAALARVVLDISLEKTLEYGLYPFVPGEILKLYLAAALLPTAWRALGRGDRG